jgi:hypothetical protein
MSAQQEAIRWRRAEGDPLGMLAKSRAAIQRVHDQRRSKCGGAGPSPD